MNVSDIIKHIREITRDIAAPYLVQDSEIITYLNEAIVRACRSAYFLTATDNTIGETKSTASLEVMGTSGAVSSITVNGIEILNTTINYTTSAQITAQLIANAINSNSSYIATVNSSVVNLTSPAGIGQDNNNLFPVITGNLIIIPTAFIGGVNGICKISVKSGISDYSYSDKIIKINKYVLQSNGRMLIPVDHRNLHWNWRLQKGNPNNIVVGENFNKFSLDRQPLKNDTINLSVVYLPLTETTRMNDTPPIPSNWHIHLCDYILYKIYNKQDSELRQDTKSQDFLNKFIANFGDGETTTADMEVYRKTMLGDNIDGLY